MRVVVQRVGEASVRIDGKMVAEIKRGLLLLVGVEKSDTKEDAEFAAERISRLRIFEDESSKMNLDIKQVAGEVLSVSQFTLVADLSRGNRPSFDNAASPDHAVTLWKQFNSAISANGIPLKEGEFGASMDVSLVNDGPVTIIIDTRK
jgi:D-tyrosyl-tRNA(Tyr) deacylase